LDFYTDFTHRLEITQGGLVGIGLGTNPPSSELEVASGDVRVDAGRFLITPAGQFGNTTNYGVGYATNLPGISVDGPFIFGYNGGALGGLFPTTICLSWDFNGDVWVSNNLSADSINCRNGPLSAPSIDCRNGPLSFGGTTEQMLSLYSNSVTCYAIGVQSQDIYFRCGADVSGTGFAWFRGGQPSSSPYDNGGGATLMTLTASGLTVNGTFISSSDRNVKQDFAPVDCWKVLEQVAQLPEQTWAYKDDPGTKHLGPMAQDFYAAFGTGADDKHIAVVDEGGVALAAIQGLDQKLKEKDTEIKELKQSVDELKKLVQSLAERK
jgi:hypothetical protein